MAEFNDVEQALLGGIAALAKRAADTNYAHGVCLGYAQAANQLAEALAWITSPGQPHGGNFSS